MTRECKCCHHIYGRWRPQCPACGTKNDEPVDTFNVPRLGTVRVERAKREPRNACIVCHRGGAKKRCPECNEPIHPACLRLHREGCAKFQLEVKAAEAKLAAERSR